MYKILLVDDEILVREAIRERMEWETLGYELVGDCENGKEAIKFLQQQPVDVVLTDIYMPYVDGLELSKHIHEKYPETSIIIFSGYNDFEYARQAIRYNVSEYILKPVTAKELSVVLQNTKEKLDNKQKEKQQLHELAKSHRTHKKNEEVVVSKILSNLIKGSIDVATARQELLEMGVEIKGKAYRVAILEMKDRETPALEVRDREVSTLEVREREEHASVVRDREVPPLDVRDREVPPLDEEKRKRDRATLSYAINNIASEIMERNQLGIAFRDADNLVNLLFYSEKIQDFNQQVSEICQQIQQEVNQASQGINLTIAIGTYTEVLEELHKSYETATTALARRDPEQENIIIDMEKVGRGAKERQALLAMEFLHENYGNSELALKDVCQHLGISTSHFSGLFKEVTGKTFLKYLNGIRMEKAKQLLQETDLRNYEIAERVGFSDPHYFSIAFKKLTGKTPGRYSREVQNKEEGTDE